MIPYISRIWHRDPPKQLPKPDAFVVPSTKDVNIEELANDLKEALDMSATPTPTPNTPAVPEEAVPVKNFVEHSIEVAKQFLQEAESEYNMLTQKLKDFKEKSEAWIKDVEEQIEHAALVKSAHQATLSVLNPPTAAAAPAPQIEEKKTIKPAAGK